MGGFPPGVTASGGQEWSDKTPCSICRRKSRWWVQRIDRDTEHATIVRVEGCGHAGQRKTVRLDAFGRSLVPARARG